MQYDWTKLDREAMRAFLDKVRSSAEPMLFSPQTSEVTYTALPFYARHSLYRLVNYAALPLFQMDFLGDGEDFVYLDGSQAALDAVHTGEPPHLSEDNVLDYLQFAFDMTRAQSHDLIVVTDIANAPLLDSLNNEQQADILAHHERAVINYDADQQKFHVTSTLLDNGALVAADLEIDSAGRVDIVDEHMLLGRKLQRDELQQAL